MDERIDREKIIKILNTKIYPRNNVDSVVAIANFFIDNDLVPVVRCKDCKYWEKQKDSAQGRCILSGNYPTSAWFCANGERKDDAK